MRSLGLIVCVVLLVLALPGLGSALPPLVLSDFESDADLAQWGATGAVVYCAETRCELQPATLTRVAEHASQGASSCRLEAPPVSFPGMRLQSLVTHDWTGYDRLRFEVHNPSSQPVRLGLELTDSVHGDLWVHRYYLDLVAIPGDNHYRVPLSSLPMNDGSGSLDLSAISLLWIHLVDPEEAATIYVDNVRLETDADPLEDAARGIWKFDFGTDTSPLWPGFFRMTPTDSYPVEAGVRPFGFTNGARCARDTLGPDDLGRDSIRSLCPSESFTLSFRLDLPNGDYRVALMARNWGHGNLPTQGWSLRANGELKLDRPLTSAEFYSGEYYFRGMGEDYPLSASPWELFEEPNLPVSTCEVAVTQGRLVLEIVNASLYSLIVYPAALESEMAGRLTELDEEREDQFNGAFWIMPPRARTFTPTAEESARGFAAWSVAVMDPVYPDTLPPTLRAAPEISVTGVPGERVPAGVALRPLVPLSGVRVVTADLSDGLGHAIPAEAIEPRYVRYFPARDTGEFAWFSAGVLYWEPRVVQNTFPLALPEQVTKQLWLTVTVPEGTVGGVYRGQVTITTSAADLVVPLTVEVWPLTLDSAENMSYGFYYTQPEDRYAFKYFSDRAGAADEILRRDFADLKRHGFTTVQFPTPLIRDIDRATGHVGMLDTSALERFVAAMRETGFGGRWKGQWITHAIGCCIYRSSEVEEFDANHSAAYQDVIQRMEDWSASPNGVPLVDWVLDEPHEISWGSWDTPRPFDYTMRYLSLLNAVPGTTSTLTVMFDGQAGVDYTRFVDALDVVQPLAHEGAGRVITKAIGQGKPVWLYNTGGDLRMVYGFYQYGYLYEKGGTWEWHFDWLDTGGFDPFAYSPFNSHWHYTYPSPEGPIPTLRYEWASQGIWDYRYAHTLQQRMEAAYTSGDPDLMEWAGEAELLLAELESQLPQFVVSASWRTNHFAGIPEGPGALTEVEEALGSYRRRIAELLLAQPGPLPTPGSAQEGISLPAAMEWEQSDVGSVTFRNLGTMTWTAGDYGLLATGGVDRWGLLFSPLGTETPPDGLAELAATLVAPPVTTLSYPPGGDLTAPGVMDTLPLYLGLAQGESPIPGGTVMEGIVISRFSDVQPGTAGEWARFYVEECAGRVPQIVGGYRDGTYRPVLLVDRGAMAVFMARALRLSPSSYEGRFTDVSAAHWAAGYIEALARAGIVGGYGDGSYRPTDVVTREAMAAYVARGLAGGDSGVPPGPSTASFSDVPTSHWAFRYVEYAKSRGVVGGYADLTYRPTWQVTRDQMAVYVYRGFVQPTGAVVALAGPAITRVDPTVGGECGWASAASVSAGDPGDAYIAFDARRLAPGLAAERDWQVRFELREAAAPGAVVSSQTVSFTAGEIAAARAAAGVTGRPHWTVSWSLPSGLPVGSYALVVSVEDETGAEWEVARQPALTILP